jgi:glycogen debranching enzyme
VRFTWRTTAVFVALLMEVVSQAQPASSPQARLSSQRDTAAKGGLMLERPTRSGAFLDVVGRRAAFVGYEHRGLEAWVYPLKLLDDLQFSFHLDGYPLEISGAQALARIAARPESTTLTFSHAAFTARVVLFAPIDEPALVAVVEADTTLPLSVRASFRPRLRLMWPAGLQTGNVGWNARERVYELTEESSRFAGVVGAPFASDASLMPYQEEPRDVPVSFALPAESLADRKRVPIVIAGSVKGIAEARGTYQRVVSAVPELLAKNAAYYRHLLDRTISIDTPDDRLDEAFAWGKVGMDKGIATNPLLGTGLIAGFRTSGESERPGFAWYFGRDALWTSLALTAEGDLDAARTALTFLQGFQRDDGKVPHEISQSASLIPWFTDYPYAWASADATPLFLIAHADYWRASGDSAFLQESWPKIVKAWEFSSATDNDSDGLIENTSIGHGWVEGGALYPPHEEIYLQGTWVAAQQAVAELAAVLNHPDVGQRAAAGAERTREAVERTYWSERAGEYLYATKLPRRERVMAEPGPHRERRQARLDEIASAAVYEESTVLPAVPMWWRVLRDDRSDLAIDSFGGGALATDWGHRLLSSRSALYDPLSYHYGSVWPLFTGWAAVGAYKYGRSHVGYQAVMANALLTRANALGYVTELLSGDFQAPFGRSSHHQIWSEAMVVSPVVRGLLGLDVTRDARGVPQLMIAPQLPPDWDRVRVTGIVVRHGPEQQSRYDVRITRLQGALRFDIVREGHTVKERVVIAPALPLDARVSDVIVNGRRRVEPDVVRRGDVQIVSAAVDPAELGPATTILFRLTEGTDVYRRIEAAPAGAVSRGLRILRARAGTRSLDLRLEGLAQHAYVLHVRTPRRLGTVPAGVQRLTQAGGADTALEIAFDGNPGEYIRRDVSIPLQ